MADVFSVHLGLISGQSLHSAKWSWVLRLGQERTAAVLAGDPKFYEWTFWESPVTWLPLSKMTCVSSWGDWAGAHVNKTMRLDSGEKQLLPHNYVCVRWSFVAHLALLAGLESCSGCCTRPRAKVCLWLPSNKMRKSDSDLPGHGMGDRW